MPRMLIWNHNLTGLSSGYAIKDVGGVATAVSPGGSETFAGNELTLTLNTNFDCPAG